MTPLFLINSSIEKVISYDPVSQNRLKEMEGRSMCWVVSDWGFSLVLKVQQGRLLVDDRFQRCQVVMTATSSEFFSMLQRYRNQREPEIDMAFEGNPLALQDFSQLFKSLDIDWEALLEGYIGTLPTQIVSRSARFIQDQATRVIKSKDWFGARH